MCSPESSEVFFIACSDGQEYNTGYRVLSVDGRPTDHHQSSLFMGGMTSRARRMEAAEVSAEAERDARSGFGYVEGEGGVHLRRIWMEGGERREEGAIGGACVGARGLVGRRGGGLRTRARGRKRKEGERKEGEKE